MFLLRKVQSNNILKLIQQNKMGVSLLITDIGCRPTLEMWRMCHILYAVMMRVGSCGADAWSLHGACHHRYAGTVTRLERWKLIIVARWKESLPGKFSDAPEVTLGFTPDAPQPILSEKQKKKEKKKAVL